MKIHVTYCGAWGYGSKFRKFASELEAQFPQQLEITGEGTPAKTGFFEVVIVATGQTIHSKKGGDGFVDSKEKMEKMCLHIKNALAAQ